MSNLADGLGERERHTETETRRQRDKQKEREREAMEGGGKGEKVTKEEIKAGGKPNTRCQIKFEFQINSKGFFSVICLRHWMKHTKN